MSYQITIWTEDIPTPSWFILGLREVIERSEFVTRVRSSRWAEKHGVDVALSDGIIETSRKAKSGFVTRLEISQVQTKELYLGVSRRTRSLNHNYWIDFNRLINNWLDSLHASAEVKSSSYVVRTRDRRRETYIPGDYHGAKSEWSNTTLATSPG